MKIQVLCTTLLLISCGCSRKNADVLVKITVKTPNGETVPEASVLLDKKLIGDTNAFGTFQWEFKGKVGTRHRIDINKSNDHYYFASHHETFVVPKKDQAVWLIEPTLYVVPKPRPSKIDSTDNTALTTAEATESPNRAATVHPIEETPFELNFHASKWILNLGRSTDEPVTAVETLPLPRPILTVHTFQAGNPVANTHIFACIPGQMPTQVCTSNERGRCVIRHHDPQILTSSTSFILRRPGYRTSMVTGPFEANSNVRTNLTPGSSFDLTVSFDDLGAERPVQNAALSIKDPALNTETSHCGFATLAVVGKTFDTANVRITHKSILHGSESKELDVHFEQISKILATPSQTRPPRLVVMPTLPGAGLSADDLRHYFQSNTATHRASSLLTSLQDAGFTTVTAADFATVLAPQNSESITLQNIDLPKNWSENPALREIGTHKLSTYLHRESQQIYFTMLVHDNQGRLVYQMQQAFNKTPMDSAADFQPLFRRLPKQFGRTEIKPRYSEIMNQRWFMIGTNPRAIAVEVEGDTTPHAADSLIPVGKATKVTLKAPPGYLDTEITLNGDSKWFVSEPGSALQFPLDLLALAKEAFQNQQEEKFLNLMRSISPEHPQRDDLATITAAFAARPGSQISIDSLEAVIKMNESSTSAQATFNAAVALLIQSEHDALARETRKEKAKAAIAGFDSLIQEAEQTKELLTSVRVKSLFYRAQAKSLLSEMDSDETLAMDSEADYREFLKQTKNEGNSAETHQRLRIAASQAIESLSRQ